MGSQMSYHRSHLEAGPETCRGQLTVSTESDETDNLLVKSADEVHAAALRVQSEKHQLEGLSSWHNYCYREASHHRP